MLFFLTELLIVLSRWMTKRSKVGSEAVSSRTVLCACRSFWFYSATWSCPLPHFSYYFRDVNGEHIQMPETASTFSYRVGELCMALRGSSPFIPNQCCVRIHRRLLISQFERTFWLALNVDPETWNAESVHKTQTCALACYHWTLPTLNRSRFWFPSLEFTFVGSHGKWIPQFTWLLITVYVICHIKRHSICDTDDCKMGFPKLSHTRIVWEVD